MLISDQSKPLTLDLSSNIQLYVFISRNLTSKSVKTPVKSCPIYKIKAILAQIRIAVTWFCLDHFDNYLETIHMHKFIKIVWS